MRNPVRPSSCVMTPAGTPNELDVQNVWKKSYTHTRTHTHKMKTKPIAPVVQLVTSSKPYNTLELVFESR